MSFDQHNWYYRKKVTAAIMKDFEADLAEAIERNIRRRGTCGLLSIPTLTGVGPNFIYEIESNHPDGTPLAGWDLLGRYTALDVEPKSFDIAGLYTPPAPGKEKYLTLVMRFDFIESQPERNKLDFSIVNFRKDLWFDLVILEGVDVNIGAAVPGDKPDLSFENGLYIADILVRETDSDATTTPIEHDTTRLKLDPIREAFDRGLDGIVNKLAFISDIPPPPDVLAIILNNPSTGARVGSPSISTDGFTGGTATIPIPVGTKFIKLRLDIFRTETGGPEFMRSKGTYTIDVDADRLDGGFMKQLSASFNYAAGPISTINPLTGDSGTVLAEIQTPNVSNITTSSFGGAGGDLVLAATGPASAGYNAPAFLAEAEFFR